MRSLAQFVLCLLLVLGGCAPQSGNSPSATDPEAATGLRAHELAVADNYMVAAANPYAVEAGLNVLRQGGSAIDAAIAVQAMLTLVEPQSSGIGGGAFILYWDAKEQALHTLDARETAPKAASESLFLNEAGEPVSWSEAVAGGRSVGTPGLLNGLQRAHQRWGNLPWPQLFEDAIHQSEEGFVVSPRLQQLLEMEIHPALRDLKQAESYFYPQGVALQAGDLKRNPALAETLRRVASEGIDVFYRGDIAQAVVNAVQGSELAPGLLSLEDLESYKARWREPVCAVYRAHRVCSMGPPSSGGITLLQTLTMLEPFDIAAEAPDTVQPWHWFTQASRLAFADRNQYIADSDFVEVPVRQMLDPLYLLQRSTLIGNTDMGRAQPGDFELESEQRVAGISYEQPSTTQISIVDAEGNAVSMTSTIETGFGSGVMTNGFLLNNQLTDFDLQPYGRDGLTANRVEPGKRPRSSMSPVMVFSAEGELRHVLGSPGGPRIINYVTQTLLGLIDWQLDMQAAIDLPRVTNLNGATALESELSPAEWPAEFRSRGHEVQMRSLNSGLHGISKINGRLYGGADPRREGVAKGE